MRRTVTVSLAQIDVAWGNPEANLAITEKLTEEAHRRGSDLILFPELWTTAYDLPRAQSYASTGDGDAFGQLAQLARRYDIHITGSVLKREGDKIYNCAPLFSPQGELLGDYDKIHLFNLMQEEQYLSPGQRTPVFELPWGLCALAICYDLRFPELFRKYAVAGARMVFLPAEWPFPRLEHWRVLLKARAIENQCYIVACNRVGQGGDAQFFGHSTVVDPSGRCVVEAGEAEALLTVSLDMGLVEEARRTLTVFADRRPDIY